MKRLLIVALTVLLAVPASLRSEGPDDRYIDIYGLIQAGDQLARTNQPEAARQRYAEALAGLKQLQASYPQWNTQLIEFRVRTLESKLGPAAKPPPSEAGPAPTTVQPGTQTTPVPLPAVRPLTQPLPQALPSTAPSRVLLEVDDRDSQIQQLRQQVMRLQNDKAVLDAKLREALAVQPAAVDPRELIRAEERILALEKDKEVLRVSLQLAESKLADHSEESTAELRKSLAEARQRLAEQSDTITALRQEKTLLQQHLQSATQAGDRLKELSTENEALKKQLAQRAAAPAPAPAPIPSAQPANEQVQRELASTKAALQSSRDTMGSLQVRVRTLQEERDKLDATRRDLEAKLERAANVPSPAGNAESARLAQLQRERDELQSRLAAATQDLATARAKASQAPAPPPQLSSEADSLRARLAVLEARKVPYSAEELALFKKPAAPQAVAAALQAPAPPATRELPASAATLLAEAHRAFSARRFDEAEKKYLEVLETDDKNTAALQRVAAVQLEQNRPKDAEAHLKKALEVNPKDARTLLLMGIAQFDQNRFDEAFDCLSRSAEADPQNPETQNYLGITLSQKGQRAAAETALRKAIQLSPAYPSAHYNLAVIYATQQPPFAELARFHYQKALAFGHAPNPELEKIMERKEPAAQP